MSKLYLTQRARDEMMLVSLAIVPYDPSGAQALTRLMLETADAIAKNPTSGESHTLSGFELSPKRKDKPLQLIAPREIWVFDLTKVDETAHYQLLYRVVDGVVEIGRLIHRAMDFREHIPMEWLIETARDDAA